ncbi:MAG: CBS domain-containing protein [Chloroflexi bacterium]|nr:CBS domain-containing protein [Chloroflexota bacterium]
MGAKTFSESGRSSIERLTPLGRRLQMTVDYLNPPEGLVLVMTALIVGAGAGLAAVLFIWLLAQWGKLTQFAQAGLGQSIGLVLVMGLVGLGVGYVANYWADEVKGGGIPEVIEAVALRNGRIRPRVILAKMLASSLTIGVGGSAGREGPIAQIGSAFGSTVGQLLHFSSERTRTLVACGAAAGVAASFNAPIAGSLFALEIILDRFTTRYFSLVVISSVTADIVARIMLGDKPAFIVPAYPFQPGELPIYIMLGILAGPVAVLFIRLIALVGKFFAWLPVYPVFEASLGMMVTAGIGLLLPNREALGSGLEFIGQTIAGDFSLSLKVMAALIILKLLATGFTLGPGNSGGFFAPSLFVGAILGGIVGSIAHSLWPDVAVNPGAYAIVGMAAVFSGAARAPITAVLIVFEMSNDYKLILPLMLATVLATLLAEHLFSESMYTIKLKQKGIGLQRGGDQDLMQELLVSEAMTAHPLVVQCDMPLSDLGALLQQNHSHRFPVVDDGLRLVGIVSIRDYETAVAQAAVNRLTVQDIATMGREMLIAYEEESLSHAIQRMATHNITNMPVVKRESPEQITGVIRRRDVIKAYKIALARRVRGQTDFCPPPARRTDEMRFVEIEITPDCCSAHKTVAELAPTLPYDCVVVSIRRQGSLLIPHGDTTLQPGDLTNVFVRRADEAKLRRCLLGEEKKAARRRPRGLRRDVL